MVNGRAPVRQEVKPHRNRGPQQRLGPAVSVTVDMHEELDTLDGKK